MPYAYKQLTDQQKRSIKHYGIWIDHDNIKLALYLNCPLGHIENEIIYNKYGNYITTVKFGNEESPPIHRNCVDVFLEDLEMLLKHQKSVLQSFYLNFLEGYDEDCAKICERLEMILKSRQLSTRLIQLVGTTVDQSMSIVTNFDPSELRKTWIISAVDSKNFNKYRHRFKKVEILNDGEVPKKKCKLTPVQKKMQYEVCLKLVY
ncbi:unnamed protein product [Caenorhabditis nigoni]